MKRILMLSSMILVVLFLAACGISGQPATLSSGNIKIVTTIFPPYDFAREIAKDKADITLLLKPGAESHSFEPTPQDIKTIENADLFIYTGSENDVWVEDLLASLGDRALQTMRLIDCVPTVTEEVLEGMEHEHEEDLHDGVFEDADVQDRTLADWQGDWQSVYPYLLDGTLDPVFAHKAAEKQDKTEAEYKAYYTAGYQTDIERITIDGDTIAFFENGKPITAKYIYEGFRILTYESGKKGVRYQFQSADPASAAPKYIQFSDHEIGPVDHAEHFHIFMGNDGFDKLSEEMENWPTYYDSSLTGDEVLDEMLSHDHEEEIDEHVWTSPANAMQIAEKIAEKLMEIDSENALFYSKNAVIYTGQLKELDAKFKSVVANSKRKTILFGDRFPFRYLADAYGLTYYAAFTGCSTETEADPATIAFLIDQVKKEDLPVVFTIELSNGKIADAICDATHAQKRMLHSCHNLSAKEVEEGATYLSLMEQNLEVLKEALN